VARGRKRWRRVLRELHSELSAPEHSRRLLFRPRLQTVCTFSGECVLSRRSAHGFSNSDERDRGATHAGAAASKVYLTRCARSRVAAGRVRPGSGTSVVRGRGAGGWWRSRSARPARRGAGPARASAVPFLAFLRARSVLLNFDTARPRPCRKFQWYTHLAHRSAAGPESGSGSAPPAAPGCANCAFARATNWSHFIMTANSL
jgi:hypothetical protein